MRSIALKLILAFLLVSLTGTALVAVFAGQATANEFGHFMFVQNREIIITELSDYYRNNREWAGVADTVPFGGMMGAQGMHGMGPGGGLVLTDATGRVIVPGGGQRLGEQLSETELSEATPIRVDGQLVGMLIEGRGAFGLSPAGAEFLAGVNRVLIIAALGATVVAVLLGVLLARTLTRPLRELTAATRAVAQGDLEQRVPVHSRDELGELAESFNRMSADLARSRDVRRQMTADVAHELRTPLSVILGHAEALRDGMLQPTSETLDIVHDEAQRLNRLVEDLRTLSLAEAGELKLIKRLVSPQTLLDHVAAGYGPRAQQQNVSLQKNIASDLPDIEVDPDRMAQVLANLMDNALRHTPASGSVTLSAARVSKTVRLAVHDTGPGITPEDLLRIFDRFYRVDKSRRRDQGGSGLGLAIAKSIVEAHGGRIWVESRLGEGAQFFIDLPAARERVVAGRPGD